MICPSAAQAFRVKDDNSAPIGNLDARALTLFERFNTIDKLFVMLRRKLSVGQDKFLVQYDSHPVARMRLER